MRRRTHDKKSDLRNKTSLKALAFVVSRLLRKRGGWLTGGGGVDGRIRAALRTTTSSPVSTGEGYSKGCRKEEDVILQVNAFLSTTSVQCTSHPPGAK